MQATSSHSEGSEEHDVLLSLTSDGESEALREHLKASPCRLTRLLTAFVPFLATCAWLRPALFLRETSEAEFDLGNVASAFELNLRDLDKAWSHMNHGSMCKDHENWTKPVRSMEDQSLDSCKAQCLFLGTCQAIDFVPGVGISQGVCFLYEMLCFTPSSDTARGNAYRLLAPPGFGRLRLFSENESCDASQSRYSDWQVLMLYIETELSAWRIRHFLESAPLAMRCRLQFQRGINALSYANLSDLVNGNNLVRFDEGSGLQRWRDDLTKIYLKYNEGTGWICCAAGHLAMWRRAAWTAGWTILLEDDAVVRSGWSFDDITQLIIRNAKKTADSFQHPPAGGIVWPDATPQDALVWLEARPYYNHWGTAAYALTGSTAQFLVNHYHFQDKVDIWMLQSVGPDNISGHLLPRFPLDVYPFYSWSEHDDVPSEIKVSYV